jgi:hypothetical protein
MKRIVHTKVIIELSFILDNTSIIRHNYIITYKIKKQEPQLKFLYTHGIECKRLEN